ncbi:hypothetical protein SUGI_0852910 [Cryptomeria japonica]|uniref:uncharacterized protein LOC131057044 n=1 Tax=Cryptomeria japonica TaxID=3369 RepID=UPI002414B7F3|nr:uncharacterized protein LOC131057044 [Cryptomeria japonica]GLJ41202.1 hypothetical protein SUGI_0852910 [Cryptomeria japonica]
MDLREEGKIDENGETEGKRYPNMNSNSNAEDESGQSKAENENGQSNAEDESGQANEVAQGLKGLDLVAALEVVEKDANEVAGSFTSLLSSLRLALSQVTSSSVEHMRCYNDVAGQLQVSALDAASKGNRFINASLRLNDEMKGTGNLAAQLKSLRRTVDHLDSLVTRQLPRT